MSAGEAMTAAYKAFRSERSEWGRYSAESIEFCIRYGTDRIVQLWDVNFGCLGYDFRHESFDPWVGVRVDCETGVAVSFPPVEEVPSIGAASGPIEFPATVLNLLSAWQRLVDERGPALFAPQMTRDEAVEEYRRYCEQEGFDARPLEYCKFCVSVDDLGNVDRHWHLGPCDDDECDIDVDFIIDTYLVDDSTREVTYM